MEPDEPGEDIRTEFTAEELSASLNMRDIGRQLTALLADDIAIVSSGGTLLYGKSNFSGGHRFAITLDFEPIAWLICNHADNGAAAAQLLQVLFANRARYQMAADMHKSVTLADFNALQEKNLALESANRHIQSLVDSLEEKVHEQVTVIENNQRKLYEHAKLAAVGQLAAGMAHEINNPIGFITSNFNAQIRYCNKIRDFFARNIDRLPDDVLTDYRDTNLGKVIGNLNGVINESIDGCNRIRDIVKDLRVFANIDQADWSNMDINAIIHSVCHVLQGRFDNAHCLHFQSVPLPIFQGQPGFIAEALFSLISNALEAVAHQDDAQVDIRASHDNQQVVISIEDNGPGIPSALAEKIFDPFFTTKAVGEGTGLGLSTSRDIVSAHGGRLQVENRSGGGTRATISLPLQGKGS